jgi:hypothetical protein
VAGSPRAAVKPPPPARACRHCCSPRSAAWRDGY